MTTTQTDNPASEPVTQLHAEVQGQLNAMLDGGTPYVEDAEAMFTVAMAAKVLAEGPREVARQLLLITMMLTRQSIDNSAGDARH